MEEIGLIDPKIRTLVTLNDLGSYTKTAEALSLTQPAISHHIKLLEQEFGISIFVKGKRKLKPTPEGLILLKFAHRAIALSQKVHQEIEDYRREARSLTVGITPTASDILVPQVLAAYCNQHPQVRIQIVRSTIKKIDNMLRFYEIDFAIVDGMIKNSTSRHPFGHGLPLPRRRSRASFCPAAKRHAGRDTAGKAGAPPQKR